MALPNARNQYLKTQIETASKEQLVVMLFDGIIRFTEQARKAIQENQVEESHHALMRAQAIIMELICTVDKEKGGEIAQNLMSLHAYAFNCLILCNMKKDVTKIDEVQRIYRELRIGWLGAMDNLGISTHTGKPLNPGPTQPSGSPKSGSALAAPAAASLGKPAANGKPGIMASSGTAPAPAAALSLPKAHPAPGLTAGMAKSLSAANAADSTAASAPAAHGKPAAYGAGTNASLSGTASVGHSAAAGAYGMGRSAMLGAMLGGAPKAAIPAQPATPAAGQAAAAPAAATAKQNAMLNAYSTGTRSIA